MAESKKMSFLHRLVGESERGNVRWQVAAGGRAFLATIADYGVSIGPTLAFSEDGLTLRIMDNDGEEIDCFSTFDFSATEREEINHLLEAIYHSARRKALGVEEVYDKLLNQLSAE